MRRMRSGQRGQGTVEFTLFLVMLTLTLMLLIQLTWVGVQKWHFNFEAMQAARSWSVGGTEGAMTALLRVTAAEGIHHPKLLLTLSWAKAALASEKTSAPSRWRSKGFSSSNSNHTPRLPGSVHGIQYTGAGTIMPIFAGGARRGGVNATLDPTSFFGAPGLGQFIFETYIPMEREPAEHTSSPKRDNDCSSYSSITAGCTGNGK